MGFANFDDLVSPRSMNAPLWSHLFLNPHARVWAHRLLAVGVVTSLLVLAVFHIFLRASWHEVDDGVYWLKQERGLVAAEIAPFGAGAAAGLRSGDRLVSVDDRTVASVEGISEILHHASEGKALSYRIIRQGAPQVVQVWPRSSPDRNAALDYICAAIAIFALLVGCSVRLRRPRDPATLHFFWLSVAFFGVFGFSFSGRLDRFDWLIYWADVVSLGLLPPLFLHFALVFPERPQAWVRSAQGRALLPVLYLPALLLGGVRAAVIARPNMSAGSFANAIETLDRLELVGLAFGLVAGLGVMIHALGRVRSVTARRQLRWLVWGTALGGVPFVLGYIVPYVLGLSPWWPLTLLALPLALMPLAFASAVVRYRLMDVEVIIKRTVVYTAAVVAIAAIYAVLLRLAGELFLGGSEQTNSVIAVLATLVVVLLAPAVQRGIQTVFDRAYYRDRYDYRQALEGFARDLNGDLDLQRLSERLVVRVMETLVVERMALMIVPAGRESSECLAVLYAEGFGDDPPPPLHQDSGIGSRLAQGQAISLDDPLWTRRFAADEVAAWRGAGVHYFFPCVTKETTIAVMMLGPRHSGEPLSSEDMTLLAAVAGQIATAIENGRLYKQLSVKAGELDRLREFSENIIASLRDGLLVVGLDDCVLRWNPALEDLYGVARADAIGQPLASLFDASFLAFLRMSWTREQPRGTVYRVPLASRHEDGARKLLVNASAEPLRTPGGAIAGTMVIIEDVTSRVQLEEQLKISDKMASVGLLAAGVAHEVNTPLTGIASFTQMLLENADPEDSRTKLLEKIERQTFRAAKIVNGLLNLARPAQVDRGPVDIHGVIGDVLSLLEHQFRTNKIQIRKELSASPSTVMGVEHKLQQVFLNLFLNARDAMPKGGWLTVSTTQTGGRLRIAIGDTGAGIDNEDLSRIYDPFFTTKPIGQGTGLGLSITYGIVQEHDGEITCESHVGQGTRFTLILPSTAVGVARMSSAEGRH